MHDKSYYGNNAELNCTWEEVCECECQGRIRHYEGSTRKRNKVFLFPLYYSTKEPFGASWVSKPDANSRWSYTSNQCYFNKCWWNNLHSEPLLVTRLPPTMSTEGKKNPQKSLSLTAEDQWLHTNCAHAICRDIYLCHSLAPRYEPYMAVLVLNDTSITQWAKVTANVNIAQVDNSFSPGFNKQCVFWNNDRIIFRCFMLVKSKVQGCTVTRLPSRWRALWRVATSSPNGAFFCES